MGACLMERERGKHTQRRDTAARLVPETWPWSLARRLKLAPAAGGCLPACRKKERDRKQVLTAGLGGARIVCQGLLSDWAGLERESMHWTASLPRQQPDCKVVPAKRPHSAIPQYTTIQWAHSSRTGNSDAFYFTAFWLSSERCFTESTLYFDSIAPRRIVFWGNCCVRSGPRICGTRCNLVVGRLC